MKQLILILILSTSFMLAQTALQDSGGVSAVPDTVNIRAMVQQQIENAKLKHSVVAVPVLQQVKPAEDSKADLRKSENILNANFFINLPVQYQLFFGFSVLVLLVLIIRRTLHAFKASAMRTLKNKISMLREEKVVVKTDSKLNEIRKKLKSGKSIFDASEKQLSQLAKDLKIAKGELLLASRLKLFELGKM